MQACRADLPERGEGGAGCLRPTLTCLARGNAGLKQNIPRPTCSNPRFRPQQLRSGWSPTPNLKTLNCTQNTLTHLYYIRTALCSCQKAVSGSSSVDDQTKPGRRLGLTTPLLEKTKLRPTVVRSHEPGSWRTGRGHLFLLPRSGLLSVTLCRQRPTSHPRPD